MTAAGRTLERPHVWRPGSAPSALLLMHGTGGDEHDLLPLGEQLAPGAPLLAPRGTVLEGPMPRFFRRLREGVFDEADLRERAHELADFVRAASDEYAVPSGSFTAVGFSNGANMAAALLLLHPDVLTGAILIAAVPPLTEPPDGDLTGRRVLVSNGQRDPMAPVERTKLLVEQLSARGADVTVLTHRGGHQLAAEHLPAMREFLGVSDGT